MASGVSGAVFAAAGPPNLDNDGGPTLLPIEGFVITGVVTVYFPVFRGPYGPRVWPGMAPGFPDVGLAR